MSIKRLDNHVVQTDENYQIRSSDKTVLVVSPPGGSTTKIRLTLPRRAHRGHKLTIVASDIDVIVVNGEKG